MSKNLVILAAMLLMSLRIEAQNIVQQMETPVEVLSEPQKLAPTPANLVKDCSPEEKLTIDCREIKQKLSDKYKAFKTQVEDSIKYHAYDVESELKKIVIPQSVKDMAIEFKKNADKQTPKDLAKLNAKILKELKVKTDVNCFLGPDGFYLYDPKFNKCSNGFSHAEPYNVTVPKIEKTAMGDLTITYCRAVKEVLFAYKICGERYLEDDARWISKDEAKQNVTEITEVMKKKDYYKDYHFVSGEKFNLYHDLKDFVEQVIRKKHPKCVPLL